MNEVFPQGNIKRKLAKTYRSGGTEVTIGNNEKTIVALDALIDTVIKAKAELYTELNK